MTDIELLKKSIKDKININPLQLSGNVYPVVDNGYGSLIKEPDGIPEDKIYTNPVRISTEKRKIKNTKDNQTPETYEKRIYFMISDYETVIDIDLEFVYNSLNMRVKKYRELIKYGEIYGYEYELEEIGVQDAT